MRHDCRSNNNYFQRLEEDIPVRVSKPEEKIVSAGSRTFTHQGEYHVNLVVRHPPEQCDISDKAVTKG